MEPDEAVDKAVHGLKELRSGKNLGIICRNCHKRTPWKKLTTEYSIENGRFVRAWFCSCGLMVREDVL
jgi:hypothetical protein